jgi:hypothetical protein
VRSGGRALRGRARRGGGRGWERLAAGELDAGVGAAGSSTQAGTGQVSSKRAGAGERFTAVSPTSAARADLGQCG